VTSSTWNKIILDEANNIRVEFSAELRAAKKTE